MLPVGCAHMLVNSSWLQQHTAQTTSGKLHTYSICKHTLSMCNTILRFQLTMCSEDFGLYPDPHTYYIWHHIYYDPVFVHTVVCCWVLGLQLVATLAWTDVGDSMVVAICAQALPQSRVSPPLANIEKADCRAGPVKSQGDASQGHQDGICR